jgi:branched-subunit amino acid transport protein
LAGYLLPASWFERASVRRLIELLPIALLGALVVVEAVADGRQIHLDAARLAGLGVGAIAVWRRAPFIVVVLAAGVTAALLRLMM